MATFVTKLELVSGKGEVIYLSFIPSLPTIQVLIACSMQKKNKHGPFYQVHDVSVYLGRQRRGGIHDRENEVEALFNSFCPKRWNLNICEAPGSQQRMHARNVLFEMGTLLFTST